MLWQVVRGADGSRVAQSL